jgi:hypothetical protein
VFFGIGFPVSVNDLYSILQASGISLSRLSHLPSELDGFHHSYGGTNQIVLNGTNSKEHEISVLLHEIRGVMNIMETGRSERDDPSGVMDESADMFALAVTTPSEMVLAMLLAAVWDGMRLLPVWAQVLLVGMGLMVGALLVASDSTISPAYTVGREGEQFHTTDGAPETLLAPR